MYEEWNKVETPENELITITWGNLQAVVKFVQGTRLERESRKWNREVVPETRLSWHLNSSETTQLKRIKKSLKWRLGLSQNQPNSRQIYNICSINFYEDIRTHLQLVRILVNKNHQERGWARKRQKQGKAPEGWLPYSMPFYASVPNVATNFSQFSVLRATMMIGNCRLEDAYVCVLLETTSIEIVALQNQSLSRSRAVKLCESRLRKCLTRDGIYLGLIMHLRHNALKCD